MIQESTLLLFSFLSATHTKTRFYYLSDTNWDNNPHFYGTSLDFPVAYCVLRHCIADIIYAEWGEIWGDKRGHTFCKEIGREMARQRKRRERTAVRGLGWCLRTQGVIVVCLAVNHPHFDSLCCLWAQCPSATCGYPSSLCYSVGTMLCWWISTFYPWAAKRTLAGSLRATSRYRHGEMGVAVIKCEREYMASLLLETFSKGRSSVESKMTLSLVYFHCWRTVPISLSATCGISVIIFASSEL